MYKRLLRYHFFLICNPNTAKCIIMTLILPKELVQAKELIDQAKLGEALEIIEKFENDELNSPEDQLSTLLIKARIFGQTWQFEKCVEIYEKAIRLGQDLGLFIESVRALNGMAITKASIGDYDKAFTYVTEAERKLKSVTDDSEKENLRRSLLIAKSWLFNYTGNSNKAVELAQNSLKLIKELKIDNKSDLALNYYTLGSANLWKGDRPEALKYAMKSLELYKELNQIVNIAAQYLLIARIYFFEGDYDQALKTCKKCLSIKDIAKRTRHGVLWTLANVYFIKSEINRSLKYGLQGLKLAEEMNHTDTLIQYNEFLGNLYRIIGKIDSAIEYTERSLMISEKWGLIHQMSMSLMNLILIYVDEDSREIANRYFSRLSELYNKSKEKGDIDISVLYLVSKAYIMKASTRIQDRAEAQTLYKQLIELLEGDKIRFLMSSLSHLCELLLEELSLYNDSEILDEIEPLITKCLDIAEHAPNYLWLANTKLLQGKLALIQMNFEEAKRFMVEAQRIADIHGLNFLAQGISNEHDKLLNQIDIWETVKKEGTSASERIKLASANGVLERIQGKRALNPPDLADEESILLLIMDSSGVTYFNHPFIANWDHSDLFSSFLSAFNTFSSEIFSKSIDRIRIGENTILINPVEPFLACYVIKGQSYSALQKLTRFTEAIKNNLEIWQALNKSIKTSEMLELDRSASLKMVIEEIF